MNKLNKEMGLINTIILIIIGLAALKYFLNWDIFDAAASEQGQGTIGYVRNIIDTVWSYIGTPVSIVWNQILWPVLNLGWQSLQAFIEWGRSNAARGI